MTKLKKHHKIHLSYILIIIVIVILFILSVIYIKNSSNSFVVQQVYYKEIETNDSSPSVENSYVNDFLDEDCFLGDDIECSDFDISDGRIDVWASHKFDLDTILSIQSPLCRISSTSIPLTSGTTFNFILDNCVVDIADEKNLIDIPLVVKVENSNINRTQVGFISTTLS